MNTTGKALSLSIPLVCIIGSFTWLILETTGDSSEAPRFDPARHDLLQQTVEKLDARLAETANALILVEERLQGQGEEIARLRESLAARLERAPGARGEETSPEVDVEPAALSGVETDDPDSLTGNPVLDRGLETLLDPGADFDEKYPVWQELAKKGLIDDAVAVFEQRVEEDPDNPDAHADLGDAYIQKIFTVPDPEKAVWSMKADKTFDAALELDPRHWRARFNKAVNYSFAPPIFGLQSQAIQHFQTLVEQQEQGPVQPHYAQTYQMLGNLLENTGKPEEARKIWTRGVEFFPDNRNLNQRLEKSTEG